MDRVEFEPCPKCGENEPSVVYMVNGSGKAPGGWPRSCNHGKEEHFDATCHRCQFRWLATKEAGG
jgi:hypothetical protein